MLSKSKIIILTAILLVVTALGLSSLGSSGFSGTLTLAGSTSVHPLAEELAQVFMEKHPNVHVFVTGGGSSAGIKAVTNRTADIGNASRDLKPTEKLHKTVIALDGIAIGVNPKNSLDNLTFEQAQQIFAGEIKDWKDLDVNFGLPKNNRIVVVNREAGSGTRGAFEELVMEKSGKGLSMDSLVQASNGAVQQTLVTTEQAIGYLSFGYLEGVKAVKVDGVGATVENVKNSRYPLARPFLMTTKDAPAGLAKVFLDFVLSAEGQEVVVTNGYISVK